MPPTRRRSSCIERLSDWLVANGKASSHDFDAPPAPESTTTSRSAIVELRDDDAVVRRRRRTTARVEFDQLTQAPPVQAWDFPPLEAGTRTEAIAVVAPKGGQGKTTLAINLATGLAEVAPNSVVLVDADLQFGDITTALGLEPERTIVDAVADAAADEIVLKTVADPPRRRVLRRRERPVA